MKFIYSAIIGLFLFGGIAHANEVPKLTGRIVDPGNLITEKTKAAVRLKIEELEKGAYPVHFVALVYDQKLDEPIEDFSIKTARAWGLGKKEVDNGILFTIAPKDGKTRIEVGYRLEGMMPDAVTKTMQENIVPLLKERKFGGSINGIIDQIKPLVASEAKSEPIAFSNRDSNYQEKQEGSGFMTLVIVFLALLALLFLFRLIMKGIRETRVKEQQASAARQDALRRAELAERERKRRANDLKSSEQGIPVMDKFPSKPTNVQREPERYIGRSSENEYRPRAPLNARSPDLNVKPPITPAPPMRPTVKRSYPTPVRDTPTSRRHDDDNDSGLGSALLGGAIGAALGSALSGGSSRSSDSGYGSGSSSRSGSDDTPSYKGGGGDFGGGGSSNTYDSSPSDSGSDGGGGGGGGD